MPTKRVVFATFGSLGDLYPYLAVARELQKRGYSPVIATAEYHRKTVENISLGFFAARPDLPRENLSEHFARVMEPRGGTKYLFQNLILPALRESYADLSRAISVAQATDTQHDLISSARILHRHILRRNEWAKLASAPDIMNEYNAVLYRKNETVRLKKDAAVFNTVIKEVAASGELITYDTMERRFTVGEVEFTG